MGNPVKSYEKFLPAGTASPEEIVQEEKLVWLPYDLGQVIVIYTSKTLTQAHGFGVKIPQGKVVSKELMCNKGRSKVV